MTRFRDYRSVAPTTAAKEFELEERETQTERRPFRFSRAAPAPSRCARARIATSSAQLLWVTQQSAATTLRRPCSSLSSYAAS